MRTHRWIDMYPDEFFCERARHPVCYMAYGLAEPHGVHNAMGVDYYNSDLLCERAAEVHGGIVFPASTWHIQEQPYYDWERDCCSMGMSLSSSIPESLFLHNMLHHIRNMDDKGFGAGFLLSGHYLGDMRHDMQLLCEYYRLKTGAPMRFWAGCVNDLVPDVAEKVGLPEDADAHAGLMETSMVMALKPESVDLGKSDIPVNAPDGMAGGNEEYGAYCAPKDFEKAQPKPSAQIGEAMLSHFLDAIGRETGALLDGYDRPIAYKAPTIIDMEALWTRFELLTSRYWRCVLTRAEAENGIVPPEFPGFEALGEHPCP